MNISKFFFIIAMLIMNMSLTRITAFDEVISALIKGNEQFISGDQTCIPINKEEFAELASSQQPSIIVLSCSDSRVSPEIIFNKDLGDLFVIRNAGNVIDPVGLGSIEYAIKFFKSKIILVLGHKKCGAVTAALDFINNPSSLQELKKTNIINIVNAIVPAIKDIKGRGKDKTQTIDNAVKANVLHVVNELPNYSKIIREHLEAGKIKIIGGYYDLETGNVEIV